MTWYAIYDIASGALQSGTNVDSQVAAASALAARGLAVALCPDGAQTGVWNPATLSFTPAPPEPVMITGGQLIGLFTPTEAVRIYQAATLPAPGTTPPASFNAQAFQFIKMVETAAGPFDLLGAPVSQGLALIAALGLYDDQNGTPGAATARPAAIQSATVFA